MIPHAIHGYTFLGSYTYSTYSRIFYIYKHNTTGVLYEATTGDASWIPILNKLEGYNKSLFSPKIE